ncbi:hypothetical protein ACIGO9_31070 [Nocardia asteroides]|uniref:hypothetical protein n=1 Tax=Nocardia asteroides TaxID=1824 RepID=UPI0037C8D169
MTSVELLHGSVPLNIYVLPLAGLLAVLIMLAVTVEICHGDYLRLNRWDVRSQHRWGSGLHKHADSGPVWKRFAALWLPLTIFPTVMFGLIGGLLADSNSRQR